MRTMVLACLCAAATALLASSTCLTGCGKQPSSEDADRLEPLQPQLDAMRAKFLAKGPADKVRTYEEGIDAVRKTRVVEKAVKVGVRGKEVPLDEQTHPDEAAPTE